MFNRSDTERKALVDIANRIIKILDPYYKN